jgi:two-component system, cell cycle sensor histidine kinase and response regulator CckA
MYNRRVRILLIDDDEDDYIITQDLLDDLQVADSNGRLPDDSGFDLDWVDNYDDGLKEIGRCQHDLYLVDYRLGEHDGLALIRQGITLCDAPFILLTGQGDRAVDVEAMRVGAADYLVKGSIDATLLERAIRYAVERKNAEKTRHSLEEQLRQAQKMEAIGRLAGGIAHDFNNSLTIIMTCSQLLLRHKAGVPPEVQEYAREIERAGLQASALTRQLMAISRNQELQPRLINLNALIADLKGILRRALGPNLELITIARQPVSIVKADPSQLEQVIMNLVINARDAMPDGGKVIIETDQKYLDKVYTEQYIGLEPGLYTSLIISDTGNGIPPEVLPHIFEPFFTTKDDKGTGLGLATVYGIVQQSSGQIRVYTEENFGTTFKIYLPLPMESITAHDDAEEEIEEEKTAVTRPNATILVVDDDPKIRQFLIDYLQEQGYIVLDANGAADALRLMQHHGDTIDLLITDIIMPEIGGRELVAQIRQKKPDMKVLFMSGYTHSVLSYRGMLSDDDVFLEKPLVFNRLLRTVKQILA